MKILNKAKKGSKELRFFKEDKDKVKDAINIKLELKEGRELRDMRTLFRVAISKAKSEGALDISLDLEKLSDLSGISVDQLSHEALYQSFMADYVFDKYKSKKEKRIKSMALLGANKRVLDEALAQAKALEYARELSNTPGADMTPELLLKEAKKIAKKHKSLKLKAYGRKELKKMGAGALLAVGSASKHEPKLIVLEYKAAKKKATDIVFVGKGITFDTGGLDIKPAGKFKDMFLDMSGAATVLALADLLAEKKLDKNLVFIIAAAENAIGSESYRPGDIIKTLSGKTVEVGHTDAEGRLVLADAIAYAKKYKSSLLVTLATLTGAALVALGQEANAIMSSDEEFAWLIRDWSEESGDYSWPLPLWQEYSNIMQGTFADLNNIQNKGGPYGGTVTAGAFLYEFAKESADIFLHIDMAPRMEAGPNDALPKAGGALGGPLRLLYDIVQKRA